MTEITATTLGRVKAAKRRWRKPDPLWTALLIFYALLLFKAVLRILLLLGGELEWREDAFFADFWSVEWDLWPDYVTPSEVLFGLFWNSGWLWVCWRKVLKSMDDDEGTAA